MMAPALQRPWCLIIVGGLALNLFAPAFAARVFGQSPPELRSRVPDVTKLGPQVGEKVPSFTLTDQHGRTQTLSSLMGPKGLVLVFNRSADW